MQKKRLTPPKPVPSFPALEERILKRWERERTFERSLQQTAQGKRFTFYDGPPYATGKPHTGHLLPGTVKDVIPRFKTMQGRFVERRFGWDCHGLPVEYELEKELGITRRQEILDMGIGKFNDRCREIVLRFTKEWKQVTRRLGRWVDFKDDYKTMDPDYMESIWWVVKTLWEKQLLYEGRRSMHVCPRCATPLSNFEVALGYADRKDPAVYVKFPLVDQPDVSLVAWTTTPWTLPGNVLLAVNEKIGYVRVRYRDELLVVAESRLKETFPDGAFEVVGKVSAKSLVGKRYAPPFPVPGLEGTHYQVVSDDSVTASEGTGILHVAPAFGEDDMRIGEREGAPLVQHISITGEVGKPFDRYHGMGALESNEPLIRDLKQSGRLLRKETITHPYPHCWRCDTPLLNYATNSWFVAVTKLKDRLVRENRGIRWVPEHVRDGRFGQWLEGARDWSISRYRFWGTPIPIWRCENGHLTVIGSRDELAERSGARPDDLHRQHVDPITFPCEECSAEMRRIEDVLDVWFDSGSMPFAQRHYPMEHAEDFKDHYPADFISEAADQTRGWFYTLHVLGAGVMGQKAYRNVVLLGLILAEDGRKLSKRLKNFPDLDPLFARHGADAIRLYLMMQPVVRGEAARFSEQAVAEVARNFTGTLYNAYSFLATYAAVDSWSVAPPPPRPVHVLDRWILSRMTDLNRKTTAALEEYDLMRASRELYGFVDELSNWYIRRSRRRFWKSGDDRDKREAFATLHHVLVTFCELAAPFAPFITDHIYRELTGKTSVHLVTWPTSRRRRAGKIEEEMALAREAVSLGLAARSQARIRVRQPIGHVRITTINPAHSIRNKDIVRIIGEELNAKTVDVSAGTSGTAATVRYHPNFAVIGPLAGSDAQVVGQAITAGKVRQTPDGWSAAGVDLPPEAVRHSFEARGDSVVEGNARLVVSLDITMTEELRREGLARELIRHFQELRKQAGLSVDDRITAGVETDDPELERTIDLHRDLITGETLARSLGSEIPRAYVSRHVRIGDKRLAIGLRRA